MGYLEKLSHSYKEERTCNRCDGCGMQDKEVDCKFCKGSGIDPYWEDSYGREFCRICDGSKKNWVRIICRKCGGNGKI